MADTLDQLWAAMEAIDPVLLPDGWRALRGECLDELIRCSILVPGDPAERVRCPVCTKSHFETVIARTRKDGAVEHFIKCPREMRVRVEAADRMTYRVDVHAVARLIAGSAGLTGEVRSLGSDRVIDCGHRIEGGVRVDVVLARGLDRQDGASVIASLPQSPIPRLLLVPRALPDSTLWSSVASAALPLRGLALLADGVITVDSRVVRRAMQQIVQDGAIAPHIFTRKADFWEIRFDGDDVGHFKDSVGLNYLSKLLAEPHRWLASIELVEWQTGVDARGAMPSTGPTLDHQAKAETRDALADLLERRAVAEKHGALTHPLDEQIEFLMSELEKSSGLGGRERDNGDIERARRSVSTAISRDIDRISGEMPDLGRHLRAFVHMGRLCRYAPDEEMEWSI